MRTRVPGQTALVLTLLLAWMAVLLPATAGSGQPGDPDRGLPPVVIVGGTAAVDEASVEGIRATTDRDTLRLSGADRFATAAAVAARFPTGRPVVITSGEGFADALTAGPHAAALGAPILLVQAAAIPSATRAALTAQAPSAITLVGGTAVINEAVEAQLASYTDGPVTRIAGADRYATAAAVAATFEAPVDQVWIASGEDFPDGIAAGVAGAIQGVPVLLTAGTALPSTTIAALERLQPQRIVLVGGTSVVSADVGDALAALAPLELMRIAGNNRYATSVAVAVAIFPDGIATAAISSGDDFPDALALAPLAAGTAAPDGGSAFAQDTGPESLPPFQQLPLITLPSGPPSHAESLHFAQISRLGGLMQVDSLDLEEPLFDDLNLDDWPGDLAESPIARPPMPPTEQPTDEPTEEPTEQPTDEPTEEPTEQPQDPEPVVHLDGGVADVETCTDTPEVPTHLSPEPSIIDADSTMLRELVLVLDPAPDGLQDYVTFDTAGGTLDATNPDGVTLTIFAADGEPAPIADLTAALASATYEAEATNPTLGARIITVTAVDADGHRSDPVTSTIVVAETCP